MKKAFTIVSITLFCVLNITQLHAHGRFILPSHTLLSGQEKQSITLNSSISNDIFHPDKPLGNNGGGEVNQTLKGLFSRLQATVTLPDGSTSKDIQWHAFTRQSVADVTIEQPGTYRISLVQAPTPMVTFKRADGTGGRIFGKPKSLPEGASNIVYRTTASRVETFVTNNAPNRSALKSTGIGIELAGNTHPNDLFVNEKAEFQLLFNGKALTTPITVHMTQAGTRHRNKRDTLKTKTDQTGKFSVTINKAGFYLLEAEYTNKGAKGSGIDFHHYSLYITLEVFPE